MRYELLAISMKYLTPIIAFSNLTPHTSHLIPHTSYLTPHTSLSIIDVFFVSFIVTYTTSDIKIQPVTNQ